MATVSTLNPSAASAAQLPPLERGRLHEILADPLHSGAASGVTLGFVRMTAGAGPVVWLRQQTREAETGQVFAPGLATFGLDPDRMTFVALTKAVDLLRAGIDCARCCALGAVILEPAAAVDLAVTRRLVLAAGQSGVPLFLLRTGRIMPTAAWTRWCVRAAPSRPPDPFSLGPPCFDLNLVRHRGGLPPRHWLVEWSHAQPHEQPCFVPSLSGALVSVPDGRALAA